MKKGFWKKNTVIVILALFVIIICILPQHSELKETIATITAIFAAMAVFIQIRDSKNLSTGEFVLSLQQEFSSDGGYGTRTFLKCWKDYSVEKKEGKSTTSFTEADQEDVVNYLTFLESLYLMLQKNVISIEMLDELFGRRFFVIVNNREIQKFELEVNYKYYLNIYRLYGIWKKYRVKHGEDIFADSIAMRDLELVLKEKIQSCQNKKEKKQLEKILM